LGVRIRRAMKGCAAAGSAWCLVSYTFQSIQPKVYMTPLRDWRSAVGTILSLSKKREDGRK
jgi:hypothetical protein